MNLLTPSQTVGPYLAIALRWPDGPHAVPEGTPGAVWLRGRLLDGAGEPVRDGLVETWQANFSGRQGSGRQGSGRQGSGRQGSGRQGFGRSETLTGEYAVLTVKPDRVPDGDGGWQAPHVDVSVFARGLLDRLVTRIYFADEPAANAADPVLRALPAERRAGLLAQPGGDGYRLDLVLQGDAETVFFRV